MPAISFEIKARYKSARAGVIRTPHGDIDTPAFIPVGTKANVKMLDVEDLKNLGAPAVLANTYHLYLRPGEELIDRFGGIGKFMSWSGPTFTDSGGFQVFSLGFGLEHGVGKQVNIFPNETPKLKSVKGPTFHGLMRVDEDGVNFVSHLDGSKHRFTPESSVLIQQKIGADIIFAFDECTSPLHDERYTAEAMKRTHNWAERSIKAWTNRDTQALYGIIQGGAYKKLRQKSAEFITALDTPGIAIGGSLGKSKKEMYKILDWTLPILPETTPRHLLGIGEIEDLFGASAKGIDTFDCVAPTRNARNGSVFVSPENGGNITNKFSLGIRAQKYANDAGPIDPGCSCFTCQTYSRAYIRHLFASGELIAMRLATIHNLHFIFDLMSQIRQAITAEKLENLTKQWLSARIF